MIHLFEARVVTVQNYNYSMPDLTFVLQLEFRGIYDLGIVIRNEAYYI